MPLREHYPLIDDRRHADIVAEARARIPRYTPEWTDVNESDPGFTLVELFAWLTEMQIYRLSKVPQLNYLKFLELVGIEMAPARPATAEVTFPVEADYGEPYTIVSARAQISTEAPDETGPIVFETDWALTALTAKLNAVQVFDGSAYHDRTQANQDPALPFEPFGSDADTDSALMIGFQSDQEPPRVAFNLRFWVPESRRSLKPMRCIANDIRVFVSAELAWEYWNGAQWRPLDLLKDETGALTQSGHIHFRMPAKGEMPPSALGLISEPHYWLRARVIRAGYQQAPRLLAIRTNTVTVTQAETIEAEILGGSNGRPDQTVSLSSTPVIEGTLTLQVDEGEGFRTWTGVEDFFGSGPDHRHYVLNRTTGEIRFGNGRRGRVPVANPNRPSNILAKEYRIGGGKRGLVAAGTITSLLSGVAGVDVNALTNLFASYGASDEETLDQLKARAPRILKSRDRAVTPEDFELLALRAAGIARAKALPRQHPDFPGEEVPGAVTLVVVPDIEHPAPMPSEGTLRTVCAYLDQRRLLTTELYVVKPAYRIVKITAELVAGDDADLAEIKLYAEASINRYFDPLTGGEESSVETSGPGWPFGGDIYYSLVYQRLLFDGVKRVASLTIELDCAEQVACQDVPVEPGVLLTNGDHEIQVGYDFAQ
ncbi:MAG: putative baseplate assembly protein [bacterium]|nr:putative baseplate assembly protein [bacterium]